MSQSQTLTKVLSDLQKIRDHPTVLPESLLVGKSTSHNGSNYGLTITRASSFANRARGVETWQ
jgi:hypothetical protein